MIRVKDLIVILSEYNPESIVSLCTLNPEHDETYLLSKVEIHRVCDMPAVLLFGDEED